VGVTDPAEGFASWTVTTPAALTNALRMMNGLGAEPSLAATLTGDPTTAPVTVTVIVAVAPEAMADPPREADVPVSNAGPKTSAGTRARKAGAAALPEDGPA
jgi:hypothetical protein